MKSILITGSTDGLGLATALTLLNSGHSIYLHGRSPQKIQQAQAYLHHHSHLKIKHAFVADLSRFPDVLSLAHDVQSLIPNLDVLINNAGVFHLDSPLTLDGLDARFMVNSIAPYLLTRTLLPAFPPSSRVINLSSAAQAPVSFPALRGEKLLSASEAYAQSKLALTMWTNALAAECAGNPNAPQLISVNPRSFLATSMVRNAYGMAGVDVNIGADILSRAALSDEFAHANGKYYDNDVRRFAQPHPDACDPRKCAELVSCMNSIIKHFS